MFDDSTVDVATKGDQPGTSYSPHAGEFSGFDVTVTKELLDRVGDVSPYFSEVQSANRAKVLQDKDVDLVAGTFSITANRMEPGREDGNLDFVGPYASTQQGILVRKKDYDEGKYDELSDFNGTGEQVCVWEGTTSATELQKKAYAEISLHWEKDARYCVEALRNKTVAAVSTDQLILYGFMEDSKDRRGHPTLAVVSGIKFGAPNDYGIAMLKGHREDCGHLRDKLKEYVEDGNTWDDQFEDNLPSVPKAERDEAKPSTAEIDALSCRDKPADEPSH